MAEDNKFSMLGREELVSKAKKAAASYFDRFDSQRKEHEDIWKVADYMVKCAQNRTINSNEKSKGANLDDNAERANTGSTLFYRQVNQLASMGYSIQTSKDAPFKFKPIINEGVFDDPQEADEMANQWNVLARWTMKQDDFDRKSVDFWQQIRKYGNIPVMVYQKQKYGLRPVKTPDGGIDWKEFLVENYPSLRILRVDSLYTDALIGDIQGQDCVILTSVSSSGDIANLVKSDEYSAEKAREIFKNRSRYKWDGEKGYKLSGFKRENQDITTDPDVVTDLFLTYDIFMRAPIEDGEWDDESPSSDIYWMTVIGNDLGDGVMVRFEENPDPDGEFPIELIHEQPDDPDSLYHVCSAQVVRSNYSVECTLKNLAIDNGALICNPPLKEVEGAVRGTDRTFSSGQVFVMDSPEALQEFQIRDTTTNTATLLDYIQNDTKRALGTDSTMMGENFGARTSALEASNIYQNSVQPHLTSVNYILNQFIKFYARKISSYWRTYAAPGQVIAITNEGEFPEIRPANLHGEFEIEVDVVSEFEDDVVARQKVQEALTIVAQNPELMKNVDVHELLIEWFRRNKFDYTKIVKRPMDADASFVARQENVGMFNGQPATVKQGENLEVHLAEHKGERLRYNGVESQFPSVSLLDQHITETEFAIQQQKAARARPMAKGNQSEGAGEMAGNQIAAALGG